MGKLPKIGNNISLSEQAYLAIKDAIINNRLKPKEILSEEALAEELGVSRTPVRSALKRLAFERLIILSPGRNAVVADISEEDMSKVFTIRIALEPVAAKITSTVISKEQIAELEEILEIQEEAIKTSDYDLYIQKDYEFHTTIANYSNNEQLHDIIANINSQVKRFLILSTTLQKNSVDAINEHRAVVEALKQGDPLTAEAKMKNHVENVANRILGDGEV